MNWLYKQPFIFSKFKCKDQRINAESSKTCHDWGKKWRMCHSSFSISYWNFHMTASYTLICLTKTEFWSYSNVEMMKLRNYWHTLFCLFLSYNSSSYEIITSLISCSSDLKRLQKPYTFSGVRHFIFVHLIMWSRYSLVSVMFVFTDT